MEGDLCHWEDNVLNGRLSYPHKIYSHSDSSLVRISLITREVMEVTLADRAPGLKARCA